MTEGSALPPKKDVALALLERATVLVHLDPRADAVRVPPWFKKQPQLILQLGLNMPVPIRDLNVDDEGLSGTLSFNRSPHFCLVPWSAVYALVGEDGRGMVWPEDVPAEVIVQTRASAPPRESLRAVQPNQPKANQPKNGRRRGKRGKRGKRQPDDSPKAAGSSEPRQPARVSEEAQRDQQATPTKSVGGQSGAKGKRPLPPYLRVVK